MSAPIPSPVTQPGSPAGLGLGRLVVRLEGPRSRVTDKEVETVSGTLIGGAPSRLVLYVNGMAKEVSLDGRTFQVAVSLRPGLNDLRAVATDRQGTETLDAVSVEFVPPAASGIAITSPQDGHTVDADAPPIVIVEGRVEDRRVSTVWLVANQRRIAVRAHDGHFRQALPILESVVRLSAEAAPDGATPQRSTPVTVHGTPTTTMGVVVLDWPRDASGAQVEVTATWRASADRLDGSVQSAPMRILAKPVSGAPPDVFYLRNLKPGVYTFVLQYRSTTATSDVVPTLYVPEPGRLTVRNLKPVSLNGTGRVTLGKILLPQGVLWEQDEWFTGQSQTGDTITKFRFPDGVSWIERKADIR